MAFLDRIPDEPDFAGDNIVPIDQARMPRVDDVDESSLDDLPHGKLVRFANSHNIADELDEDELQKIGAQVIEEYEIDEESRAEWLDENEEAFKLAMQVVEEKTSPWPRASNIIFPLLTVGAIQFAARAMPAIVAGRNVVKGVVVGSDKGVPKIDPEDGSQMFDMSSGEPVPVWEVEPGAKRKRADLISAHMSFQVLDEMDEWEDDTDKLLHILPIAGCCFRKTYFEPALGENTSDIAFAQNIVINYWAKSMKRAPRISEIRAVYPDEIETNERLGIWTENDYGKAVPDDKEKGSTSNQDDDAPHTFIEQHRRLDLDGDGYYEPYVVTVHKETKQVARILARFDLDGVKLRGDKIVRIEPVEYYTKYDFIPNVEGGIYGIGFGKLLLPLNASINTIINQLIDAGSLANSATGFIGRGLSIHSGEVKFKKGVFKVVNAPGSRIRDAIVPLQFSEPSQVLFLLLGLLIDAAKEVASIKDVLTGETAAATMAPTTLLGLIDQGLKVFAGIYKRVHRAAKREFVKLYRLNRLYLEEHVGFADGDEWREITREDYERGGGVQPVSDPAMVSNLQKMARAELLRTYTGDPYVNQVEVRRRTFDAAEIENVDALIVEQPEQPPELAKIAAEIQIQMEKLQIEHANSRASQIRDYAQAVKSLADADKASADEDIGWAQKHLDFLRLRMDHLNGQAAAQGGQESGEPPLPGARQAEDGNWYLEDPNRPGKYVRVA